MFLKLNYMIVLIFLGNSSSFAMRGVRPSPQPRRPIRQLELKKPETKKMETKPGFGRQPVSETKLMPEKPRFEKPTSREFHPSPTTQAGWFASLFRSSKQSDDARNRKIADAYDKWKPFIDDVQSIPTEYLNEPIPVFINGKWFISNMSFLKKAIVNSSHISIQEQEIYINKLLDQGADPNFNYHLDIRDLPVASEYYKYEPYNLPPIQLAITGANVGAVKALINPRHGLKMSKKEKENFLDYINNMTKSYKETGKQRRKYEVEERFMPTSQFKIGQQALQQATESVPEYYNIKKVPNEELTLDEMYEKIHDPEIDDFGILGITFWSANQKGVRNAWLTLTQKFSPENYKNNPAQMKKATEIMQRVNKAYKSLSGL